MSKHRKKKNKTISKTIIVVIIILIIALGAFLGYRLYTKNQSFSTISKMYFMGIDENQQIGKTQTDVEYSYNCSQAIEYPIIGKDEIDSQITEIISKLKSDFISQYKDETVEEVVTDTFNGISYFQYIAYQTYLAPDNKMSLVLYETQEVGESNVISEKAYTYNFDLNTGKKLENSDVFKDGYKDKLSEFIKNYLTQNADYKDVLFEGYEDKISNKDENLNNYAITNDKLIVLFDKYDILPGNFGIVKIEVPYDQIKDVITINSKNQTQMPESNAGVKAEAKVKYTDANETVYATTTVNVRTADNTQSEKKGMLKKGDQITRIGVGDNGWSKVTYNNETAYMSSTYLTTEKPVIEEISTESVNIPVDSERNIDPSKPMVALTFDDGPNPNSTPKILETLKKYNAVATFFDLGTCMASYPKISQQEEAMGCEVGSHTYGHKNLNTLSASQIQDDIGKAENIFQSTLGHKPNLIRTPYGNANSKVKSTLHYPLINWDIDTEDWKSRDADSVIGEVRKYSNYDGRVILMHSIYTSTAKAVETLVPELISKGYQLVTIPELAKYKGTTLETGKIYYDFR